MITFVLDCSVAMAWLFDDETNAYSDSIQNALRRTKAIAPTIWPLEVLNAIEVASIRGRAPTDKADFYLQQLLKLRIWIDQTVNWPPGELMMGLIRENRLTAYDASYVCHVHRYRIPLATVDKRMSEAARAIGVPLFEP